MPYTALLRAVRVRLNGLGIPSTQQMLRVVTHRRSEVSRKPDQSCESESDYAEANGGEKKRKAVPAEYQRNNQQK